MGHDVFGRHEQFLDGGAEAALQHDGAAAAAQHFEQREVLHVARADLQDVGVFGDQVDVAVAHDLGDDSETGGFTRFGEQFQAFAFHALEIVGRSAGLKRAAAQDGGAGRGDGFGRFHDLLFAFDGAGAGHGDELIAANFGAADFDDGPLFAEFFADELVRR